MKVLLVAPYKKPVDVAEKAYVEKTAPAPPLGLWRIAGYLRRHGVEADVCDPCIDQSFDPRKYDVVGVGTMHVSLENDLSTACLSKTDSNMVVVGGVEASFMFRTILKMCPMIDYVVLGEGEKPLLRLCMGKKVYGRIARRKNGLVIFDPEPAFTKEEFIEATLTIPYGEIPYHKYWRRTREPKTIRLYTENYCPMGCTFCSSTRFLNSVSNCVNRVVSLPADILASLIEKLDSVHNPERIFIQDDNLLSNKRRILDFCKLMMESKHDLEFICQARTDHASLEVLRAMRKIGFVVIGYGVESFSQRQLDEFNKKVTVETNEKAIRKTLKAGIKPFINIILSSQDTTMRDVDVTLRKCRKYERLGCGLGINIFTLAHAGAPILKRGSIERRMVEIHTKDGTVKLLKPTRILPRNMKVRNFLLRLEREASERLQRKENRSSHERSLSILEVYEEMKKW